MDKTVIRHVGLQPFRRDTSAIRTHYSKDCAMQSVARIINETLNVSNKTIKTIYWGLHLRMIMSVRQSSSH